MNPLEFPHEEEEGVTPTESPQDQQHSAPPSSTHQRRSLWAPSANQCGVIVFVIIGCVSAVLTGLLIFNSSKSILRETAVERGESVILSARAQVHFHLQRMNSTQEKVKQQMIEIIDDNGGGHLPDTDDTAQLINHTFWDFFTVNLGTVGESLGGGGVLLYPPLNVTKTSDLPPRKRGCRRICVDDEVGTPYHEFTSMIGAAGWHENMDHSSPHQTVFPYSFSPRGGTNKMSIYAMDFNRSTTDAARLGPYQYDVAFLDFYKNGTFPRGQMDVVYMWISLQGINYYLFGYTKMYHIKGNTFMIASYDTFNSWFESITSIVKAGDEDEIILLVDRENRPIAFSHDPDGDARLKTQCFHDIDDGQLVCPNLEAANHYHWFVRAVFAHYNSSTGGDFEKYEDSTDWLEIDGRQMLLVSRDFVNQDEMHIRAFYGITQEKVIGEFLRRSVTTVVICCIITGGSAILLGVVAYVVIMDSHRYVRMAEDVSKCIVVYDIGRAMKTLAGYPSTSLRAQFEDICHNLACYKPFLPHYLHGGADQASYYDSNGDSSFGTLVAPGGQREDSQTTASQSQTSWSQPEGFVVSSGNTDSESVPLTQLALNLSQLHKFKTIQSCTVVVAKLSANSVPSQDNKRSVKGFTDKMATFSANLIQKIVESHGIVDVLLGDELRASYGAHGTLLYHEREACNAMLKLDTESPLREFDTRVAIASGPCQSGLCGNLQLTARVLVGAPIITANAMSNIQPTVGSRILAASRTVRHLTHGKSSTGMYLPVDVVNINQSGDAVVAFELLNKTICDVNGEEEHALLVSFGGILQEFAELRASVTNKVTMEGKLNVVQFKTPIAQFVHKLWSTIFAIPKMATHPADVRANHHAFFSPLPIPDFLPASGASKSSEDRAEQLVAETFATKDVVEDDGGLIGMFNAEPEDDSDGIDQFPDAGSGQPASTFTDSEDRTWMFVGKILGKGQFGTVHTVMDVEGGRFAAVKVLPLSASEMNTNEVIKEMRLLQQLSHEHICSYVGMGVTSDHFFILQELLPCATLDTLVKCAPLPWNTLRTLTGEILSALDYIHSRSVLHLDVKPQNVLITSGGNAKLNDFGSALMGTGASKSVTNVFTANGKSYGDGLPESFDLRGTAKYISPEMARSEEAAAASDMWSFGIMLIQMITGEDPWMGKDGVSMLPKQSGPQAMYKFVATVGNEELGTLPPQLECIEATRLAKQQSLRHEDSADGKVVVQALANLATLCVVRDPALRITAADAVAWAQEQGLMSSYN